MVYVKNIHKGKQLPDISNNFIGFELCHLKLAKFSVQTLKPLTTNEFTGKDL